MKRPGLGILVALAVLAGCSGQDSDATVTSTTASDPESSTVATTGIAESTTTQPSASTTGRGSPMSVLVFHKTAGFRHESIAAGVEALEDMGADAGFEITATEDAAVFSPDGLESFRVIVFLNTTGDVLDEPQQSAMEDFISSGRGFVGIHSAADTEYDWPWYGELVGAYFDSHPHLQPGVVEVEQPAVHPVVRGLPERVERVDEWYNFRRHPEPEVTVLATLDESTYDGGTMGSSHPIVWAHEYDGGRAVYIGFGHASESFEDEFVRTLLRNAIDWTSGSSR